MISLSLWVVEQEYSPVWSLTVSRPPRKLRNHGGAGREEVKGFPLTHSCPSSIVWQLFLPPHTTPMFLPPHTTPMFLPPHTTPMFLPPHTTPMFLPPHTTPMFLPPHTTPMFLPPHTTPMFLPPHTTPIITGMVDNNRCDSITCQVYPIPG